MNTKVTVLADEFLDILRKESKPVIHISWSDFLRIVGREKIRTEFRNKLAEEMLYRSVLIAFGNRIVMLGYDQDSHDLLYVRPIRCSGDLGFDEDWDFKLVANSIIQLKNSVSFDIKVIWSDENLSLNGKASWIEDKKMWMSDWLPLKRKSKNGGSIESRVIFNSITDDNGFIHVEGSYQENGGELNLKFSGDLETK